MATNQASIVLISAALFAFSGCDRTSKETDPYGTAPSTTPSSPVATNTNVMPTPRDYPPAATTTATTMPTVDNKPSTAMFTDAQSYALLDVANTGEIDQANEALKKAKSDKVKTFAQHMLKDHKQAQSDLADLAKKGNITKDASDSSRQVQTDGQNILGNLKGMTGADFDRHYMEAQIQEHQDLLDTLDKKIIPAAQNKDMKALIEKIRDKVKDHLQMARDIQGSLPKA